MRQIISTYRIQFNAEFTFRDVLRILPYLNELGITHIYASPIFSAVSNSAHGYDVIDPNRLNPELGSESDYLALIDQVHQCGLGWVQDIVPNHQSFSSQNQALMDVFENGHHSPYYRYYDIEWNHPHASLRNRVLAPFLGMFYELALESGELRLSYNEKGLFISYYEHRYPIRIESYHTVFKCEEKLEQLKESLGEEHPEFIKLLGGLYVLHSLNVVSPDSISRKGQIQFVKRIFWELYSAVPKVREYMDMCLERFKGTPGIVESFDQLDDLLMQQHYRLAYWKVAGEDINYRRFFNINGLISLRLGDQQVLSETHQLIFEKSHNGEWDGFRVDHVDGLFTPQLYLESLRKACPESLIVVEKILEEEESLREQWPIDGTTGYDMLGWINALFIKKENESAIESVYTRFVGFEHVYDELVAEKKRLMVLRHFSGDIERLAYFLEGISSRDRYGSDITLSALRRALVELLIRFPVYRTYGSIKTLSPEDKTILKTAIKKAQERKPEFTHEFDFIERFLFADDASLTEAQSEKAYTFLMRFQQLAAPVTAKGVEDTVFYIYNRMISLCEVGWNPSRFGITIGAFHRFVIHRLKTQSSPLNPLSTHDTKRSGDTRARISVLSELPLEWEALLRHWHDLHQPFRSPVKYGVAPEKNDEYMLFQTLIGIFPSDGIVSAELVRRMKEVMIKSIREAKVHTAWIKPDLEYETACLSYVQSMLDSQKNEAFFSSFLPFQKKVAFYGVLNSLSQTVLQLTMPGIADIYRGDELIELNLVDPDNRRAVDYEKRMKWLQEIKSIAPLHRLAEVEHMKETLHDGRLKLFLMTTLLSLRKDFPRLFLRPTYIPIEVFGTNKDHCIAFLMTVDQDDEKPTLLVVVSRLLTSLCQEGEWPIGDSAWRDTELHLPFSGEWVCCITNQSVSMDKQVSLSMILKNLHIGVYRLKHP